MSYRIIRRSKISLMENAGLIRPKCANGGAQHATVMEQDETFSCQSCGYTN
jgi:hypothetical protein